jgi:hypothetical protein
MSVIERRWTIYVCSRHGVRRPRTSYGHYCPIVGCGIDMERIEVVPADQLAGAVARHAAMRLLWQEERDKAERLNAANEALRDEVSRLNELLSNALAKGQ